MKTAITITIIFLFANLSYSQNAILKGHITNSKDSSNFAFVTICLMKDSKVIKGACTDTNGVFIIKDVPVGVYKMKIVAVVFNSKEIDSLVVFSNNGFMEISYPDPCQYKNNIKGICPRGHQNNVIPIVYGYPGDKLWKKAKKGKVKLGGCIIQDCQPHWYCKEHDIEF